MLFDINYRIQTYSKSIGVITAGVLSELHTDKRNVYLLEYKYFLDVVETIPYFIKQVDIRRKKPREQVHFRIHYLIPEEF